VLREDLYLELRGMVDQPIPALDEHSDDYRQIYFFRNSARTLLEIRGAIETLRKEKSFMNALSQQPRDLRDAFDDLSRALLESHELIKKLRNDVAGHLSHQALHKAMEKLDQGTHVLLQMGNNAKEIHYKFALEFIGATILRDVPFEDAENEWKEIIGTTSKLSFKAIEAIDKLFVVFARIYNHYF
jgi:hypothetical protein